MRTSEKPLMLSSSKHEGIMVANPAPQDEDI